jgi:hypothetical protein
LQGGLSSRQVRRLVAAGWELDTPRCSFYLGHIVYALDAPADGASKVAELWHPRLGHPGDWIPYAIPEIIGGVAAARA